MYRSLTYRLPTLEDHDALSAYVEEHYANCEHSISARIEKDLAMTLTFIKAFSMYKEQICEMLDEWHASGEQIVPHAIRKINRQNYDEYPDRLEGTDPSDGRVPDSTFFCLDQDRNVIVGAVNIRHYLNESLLLNGGHIGDGVRPSERRKGIATRMIALALEECRKLGIKRALIICDKDNIGSAKSIINNSGVLANEVNVHGVTVQRYWIDLYG